MLRHALIAVASACLPALCVSDADAQTMPERGYQPVDQTIDDVDPLRVSLLKPEAGLLNIGERHNVFRAVRPGGAIDDDRLYYVSYGVTAEYDRSEYARLRNGALIQFVPPDTVYHLGLPPTVDRTLDPPTGPDHRLDLRVDRQVHPTLAAIGPDPAPAPPTPLDDYHELADLQRAILLQALDRRLGGGPS